LNPELLAPAGSLEKLEFAYAFGADAAYGGVPLFSLRARENEFNWQSLAKGAAIARALRKKIYFTANIFARNTKIKPFSDEIVRMLALKPDGLIMSDPGLIAMVRERDSRIPIHLSVQANCTNWRSAMFWRSIGVSRIILSRELRLEEIRTIKEKVPGLELEAFVHGAMCIAYSGRCLLSRYMSYRDANQGVCDNSCRYPMRVYKKTSDYLIEDQRTPGRFYPIEEDEHGTYILSAKDLSLIEHLKDLSDAGVTSFKIEGRSKSVFYLAVVARAYRLALNALAHGLRADPELIADLERVTRRGYHAGFLFDQEQGQSEQYSKAERDQGASGFLGIVRGPGGEPGQYRIDVRGKFRESSELEAMSPHGIGTVKVGRIWGAKDRRPVEVNSGIGEVIAEVDGFLEKFTILRRPSAQLQRLERQSRS
jgi:putative protease